MTSDDLSFDREDIGDLNEVFAGQGEASRCQPIFSIPQDQVRSQVTSSVRNGPSSRERKISCRAFRRPDFKRSKSEDISNKGKKKNDRMVLQLVLPVDHQNQHPYENYLSYSSQEDILGQFGIDALSLSGGTGYVNNGYVQDGREYRRSFSCRSAQLQTPHSESSGDSYPPTPQKEKNQIFRMTLSKILSGLYAMFIITFGLTVYISDIVIGNTTMAETFSIYLITTATVYVLYLLVDISLFMKEKNKYIKMMEMQQEQIELSETGNGRFEVSIDLPKILALRKKMKHHYCLSKDHNSKNFYLKLGATGFCIGHLIHSGLILGYQIVFLINYDLEAFHKCATVRSLIVEIIYPIFSFIQLYFIFKYSNIIINRNPAVARFGIMHCTSSSLCFWLWTIFRETVEALAQDHDDDGDDTEEDARMGEIFFGEDGQVPVALPFNDYNRRGIKILANYLNSTLKSFTQVCDDHSGLQAIYRNFSPYLYPFSVEFSILIVGVLYIVWQNIGTCAGDEYDEPEKPKPCKNTNQEQSNLIIQVDCHSSNKGLFGGLIMLVISIVSIILYFIAMNEESTYAGNVNTYTSIFQSVIMTIAAILAYRQITKLDINRKYTNTLDDLLLLACIPSFFLNGIFTSIASITSEQYFSMINVIFEITQIMIQTPFILDGLRRVSNSKELRREKPGRELITFLIVCNVSMWITQTFEVKSHALPDERYEVFGKELWTIIGHLCIPMMMFYRFHSSVCIVDIWKFAYESEHD